jgi:DNA-binding GntR family transcriptional regulator
LPPSHSIDLFSLAGTSAALRKSSINAQLVIVSDPVSVSAQSLLAHGMTAEADTSVDWIKLERRATVNAKPVLFETLWFHTGLFDDLLRQNFENRSISALVRDVYFLEPSSADQTFNVISASKTIAKRLKVMSGSPLLRVQRQLHFGEHKNALLAEIICSTDHFDFSQTLYPSQVADAAMLQ